jgi:hydrogenase maturation protein HypF
VRKRVSYEAQAAIELEMGAWEVWRCWSAGAEARSEIPSYPFRFEEGEGGVAIGLRELFEALLADRRRGVDVGEMAYRFHVTVAEMMRATVERIAGQTGLQTVALSGGCFQNRLLLALVVPRLEQLGLRVLVHRQVPCNDGGISLGQAVIAHYLASCWPTSPEKHANVC